MHNGQELRAVSTGAGGVVHTSAGKASKSVAWHKPIGDSLHDDSLNPPWVTPTGVPKVTEVRI